MVNIVGLRWYETMRVIRDDHRLLFSILPLHIDPSYTSTMQRDIFHAEMKLETDLLDETSDNVYTLLPEFFTMERGQ